MSIRARQVAIVCLLLLIAIGLPFARSFEVRSHFRGDVLVWHFSVSGDSIRRSVPGDVQVGEQSLEYALIAEPSYLIWSGSQLGVRWSAQATAKVDGQAVPIGRSDKARSEVAAFLTGDGPASGRVKPLESRALLRSLSSGVGHAYDLRPRRALACAGVMLLWLALLVTFIFACLRWRGDARRRRNCCARCNYPRPPDPASPCPECGTVPTDVAAKVDRAAGNSVAGRRPARS